jgi:hypothetical protein
MDSHQSVHGLIPHYREPLPRKYRARMERVARCVHCDCGGKICLNRNMRIINFALDCEQLAKSEGYFMIARVARALLDLVRHSREWEPEHFSVIDALFTTIRDLGEPGKGPPPHGEEFEAALAAVEAWVVWLEQVTGRLSARPSSHSCMRRTSLARTCPARAECGH